MKSYARTKKQIRENLEIQGSGEEVKSDVVWTLETGCSGRFGRSERKAWDQGGVAESDGEH